MRGDEEVEGGGDAQQADAHADDVGDEDLAARELHDEPDARGRSDHAHDAVGDLGGDGGRGPHACELQDLGRVVHDGVDAGGLVDHGQEDADQQQLAQPRGPQDVAESLARGLLLLLVLVGLDHLHEFVRDGAVLGLHPDPLEGPDGVVEALLGQVPARGLGHEADPDPQGHGRDRAQEEHPPPGLTVAVGDDQLVEEGVVVGGAHRAALGGLELGDLVEDVGARGETARGVGLDGHLGAAVGGVDDRVHGEGQELPGDDHQLVDGHDGAADALGRGLRQVDGHGGTGGADGEAQHDAEDVHRHDARGQGGAQGADEEEDGQEGDVVPPSPAVRHQAPDERSQRRAGQEGAGDGPLLPLRELEAVGPVGHVHVGQCAGDDARVVPEQQ